MFFKFDSITGRVSPSATSKVYNPAGLTPQVDASKEPQFIFESSKVKPASMDTVSYGDALHRQPTTGAKSFGTIPTHAGYQKVVALQKKWSLEDGLLVWQKRGIRDSGPYFATLFGIALGASYSFYLIFKMSFPKKQE